VIIEQVRNELELMTIISMSLYEASDTAKTQFKHSGLIPRTSISGMGNSRHVIRHENGDIPKLLCAWRSRHR
jgi:hypothetical protein